LVSILVADREVQRILLELLNQMDGFDQTVNVKVSLYLIENNNKINRIIVVESKLLAKG